MTTTEITCPRLGITAAEITWEALGYSVGANGGLYRAPHGIEALILAGVHATGERSERALLWAIAERQRQAEERTRVTAESRLADAIASLARELGEESAQSLVARLPERIRALAQSVANRR